MQTLRDPLTGETVDVDPGFGPEDASFSPDDLAAWWSEHPFTDPGPSDQIDFAIARASHAARMVARAAATQLHEILATVELAHRHPAEFLGPNAASDRDTGNFVERSIVLDLAISMNVSEFTVWGMLADARTLRERTPRVWAEFCDGGISHAAARIVATEAAALPDDPAVHRAFDEQVRPFAETLVPSKLRLKARVVAEEVHSIPLAQRHETAFDRRGVHVDARRDGMADLGIHFGADDAMRSFARISALAIRLKAEGDERTLEQLRADVARDLLTGDGTPAAVTATVGILVPMMTLLDRDDPTPSMLDGYGPIDPETARRLCAQAPSFRRILTDPVTAIRLTMDRTTYRPTAAQRLWLGWRDGVCVIPGCNRRHADVDHTIDWQFDGLSNDDNLALLCPGHHSLKHATLMSLTRSDPERGALIGALRYTDPRGNTRDVDPPPF